ncbi:MAG: creatininase family protein, partial [Luteolibacter sp.]
GKLQIGLIHVFKLTDPIWAEYTQDAEDLHANQAETALMLYLHPELVHMDRIPDSDEPDRTGGSVFCYPVAQTSLNGVTGHPSRATAAQGERLFLNMVNALSEKITIAIAEQPPLGPEHWAEINPVRYD